MCVLSSVATGFVHEHTVLGVNDSVSPRHRVSKFGIFLKYVRSGHGRMQDLSKKGECEEGAVGGLKRDLKLAYQTCGASSVELVTCSGTPLGATVTKFREGGGGEDIRTLPLEAPLFISLYD